MSNTLSFDESFYLSQNPDVAAAVSRGIFTSGAQHFQMNGRFEGRNPNAFFNTSFYLGQYPDVARAGINPLTHFLNNGAAEGRFANLAEKNAIDLNGNGGADDFNNAKYLADYPDVATAVANGTFKNGYQHFVQFGQFEARIATLSNGTTITGPFSNNSAASFALTTNTDALVGTSASDTFVGDFGIAGQVSAADSINGGAGNDTLNLFGATATSVLPQISNIETLNFSNPAAGFAGANVSGIVGLTTVGLANATNATTFTVNANQDVSYTNVTGAAAQNITTTATDTAITITANGSTLGAVAVTGAGITTTNIVSTGAANTTGAIDVAGSTTININAAANLTAASIATTGVNSTLNVSGSATSVSVGTLDTDLRTINASGLTAGGLTATLSNAAQVVTGGAGNDFITTGAVLTTGSVNAGAGADTLIVADSTHIASATLGAKYTNFETLQVVDGVSQDVSFVSGITGIRIADGAGATGVTNLTAAQAANVAIISTGAAGAGAITIGVAGASTPGQIDTVNATLSTTSAAANPSAQNIDLTGLTLTGVEKLSLTGTGTVTANTGSVTLTTTNATGLDTITLNNAGNGNSITIAAGHTANNLNVDASASAGSVTINATAYNTATGASLKGGAGNDVLLGSAKADILIGGAGNDILAGDGATVAAGAVTAVGTHTAANILTGGAGNDTFAFGVQGAATTLVVDTITDLNLGTNASAGAVDKLVFDLATTSTATAVTVVTLSAAQATAVTGAATFAAALDSALTAAGGVNNVVQFTYANDSYIAINGDGNNTFDVTQDHVVKVTGLTGTLDASDIVVI